MAAHRRNHCRRCRNRESARYRGRDGSAQRDIRDPPQETGHRASDRDDQEEPRGMAIVLAGVGRRNQLARPVRQRGQVETHVVIVVTAVGWSRALSVPFAPLSHAAR